MNYCLYWHDTACEQLVEAFASNWSMEDCLKADRPLEVRMARNPSWEVDEGLHMVTGAFLESEARVLVQTDELSLPSGGRWERSGDPSSSTINRQQLQKTQNLPEYGHMDFRLTLTCVRRRIGRT